MVVSLALSCLTNCRDKNKQDHEDLFPSEISKWRPPRANVVKINVDTAVFNESGCRFRVAIRDVQGIGVSSAHKFASVSLTPATQFRIQVASPLNPERVIVESDCLNLTDELGRMDKQLTDFSLIIEDIVAHSAFQECSWFYVRRVANKMAHCLAHLATDGSSDFLSLAHVAVKSPRVLFV